MLTTETTNDTLDQIITLYNTVGKDQNYEEAISQYDHAIQSAMKADEMTNDPEVIIAALLHDIGHLLDSPEKSPWGNLDHEKMGADYLLSKGFSPRIARMVEKHVMAKRYLVSTQLDYYINLSDASKKTFELQGGKCTPEEIQEFENDPLYDDILLVRICDEQGKNMIVSTQTVESYRLMMEALLLSTNP